jgi:hypothetical protein
VSHTAESVFQMAFEEIYSNDASTWHLQFHGNANSTLACQNVDVFLSNGVEAAPATLFALSANIAEASRAAAPGGPVLMVDVYDAPDDCVLRGKDNMQMRFAAGLPTRASARKVTSRWGLRGSFTSSNAATRGARRSTLRLRPGETVAWSCVGFWLLFLSADSSQKRLVQGEKSAIHCGE